MSSDIKEILSVKIKEIKKVLLVDKERSKFKDNNLDITSSEKSEASKSVL